MSGCTGNYAHKTRTNTNTVNCRELELNTGQQMMRSTVELYSHNIGSSQIRTGISSSIVIVCSSSSLQ